MILYAIEKTTHFHTTITTNSPTSRLSVQKSRPSFSFLENSKILHLPFIFIDYFPPQTSHINNLGHNMRHLLSCEFPFKKCHRLPRVDTLLIDEPTHYINTSLFFSQFYFCACCHFGSNNELTFNLSALLSNYINFAEQQVSCISPPIKTTT